MAQGLEPQEAAERGHLVEHEQPLPPSDAEQQEPEPAPHPRWLHSWWNPQTRSAVIAIVVIALIFLISLLILAPGRSFHPDELTNIRMHALRAAGEDAEPQHATFHGFYAWWLAKAGNGEGRARLPSTIFVTLSLLSLAALAGRLWGRQAAVLAAALYFFWPRAWDDGLEMRYYGLIFLCSTIALHALLSLRRGAALIPFAVLLGLFALLYRWHPTPLPFLAGVIMLAVPLCAYNLFRVISKWRQEGTAPFPLLKLAGPIVVIVGSVVAAITLIPRIAARFHFTELVFDEDAANDKFHLIDVPRWFLAWMSDHVTLWHQPAMIASVSFGLLLLLGLFLLARRHPLFLISLLLLFVGQFAAAYFGGFPSARVVVGYKYLTSSSVMLLLALAVAMAYLFGKAQASRTTAGRVLIPGLIVLLYFLPVTPRVALSALGDASNHRQIWETIFKQSGDDVPYVYGPPEFLQSVGLYRRKMEDFDAIFGQQQDVGDDSIPFFLGRLRPVFIVKQPKWLGRLPGIELLEVRKEFPSNFSTSWSMALLRPRGDVRLLSGQALDLRSHLSVLPLEDGAWKLAGDGSAVLDGRKLAAGETLLLEEGKLLEFAGVSAGMRLLPDYSTPALRGGGFAQRGGIDAWNRPKGGLEDNWYELTNNYSLAYDFYFPEGESVLSLIFETDTPGGGGFLLEFDGVLQGLFSVPEELAAGTVVRFNIPVPDHVRGKSARVFVTNLAENAVKKKDDDNVRVFKLKRLEVKAVAEGEEPPPISPNFLGQVTHAAPPAYAPGGEVDLANPELLSKLTYHVEEKIEPIKVMAEDGLLSINLPPTMSTQQLGFPPFQVKPETMLFPYLELQAENIQTISMVPILYFFDSKGTMIRPIQICQMPIGRDSADWTRRISAVMVPPDASAAILLFFINSPEDHPTIPGARFLIRKIRFTAATHPQEQ